MTRYNIRETAVYDKYVRWCGRTGSQGPSYPIPSERSSKGGRDGSRVRPTIPGRTPLPRFHGRRHGFPGEPGDHLVAVGHVPHRRRHNRRRLLYVVRDDAFVGVEVGMVRQRIVLDGILGKPHARQPRVVERSAVGAADAAATRSEE